MLQCPDSNLANLPNTRTANMVPLRLADSHPTLPLDDVSITHIPLHTERSNLTPFNSTTTSSPY